MKKLINVRYKYEVWWFFALLAFVVLLLNSVHAQESATATPDNNTPTPIPTATPTPIAVPPKRPFLAQINYGGVEGESPTEGIPVVTGGGGGCSAYDIAENTSAYVEWSSVHITAPSIPSWSGLSMPVQVTLDVQENELSLSEGTLLYVFDNDNQFMRPLNYIEAVNGRAWPLFLHGYEFDINTDTAIVQEYATFIDENVRSYAQSTWIENQIDVIQYSYSVEENNRQFINTIMSAYRRFQPVQPPIEPNESFRTILNTAYEVQPDQFPESTPIPWAYDNSDVSDETQQSCIQMKLPDLYDIPATELLLEFYNSEDEVLFTTTTVFDVATASSSFSQNVPDDLDLFSYLEHQYLASSFVNWDSFYNQYNNIYQDSSQQEAIYNALLAAYDGSSIAENLYGTNNICSEIGIPFFLSETNSNLCSFQDLEVANRYLDDAGIVDTDGDGIREVNGVPLVIPFQTFTNTAGQNTQVLMTEWWSEIGMGVESGN